MQLQRSHPVLAVHDLAAAAAWCAAVLGTTNRDVDSGNWVFCSSGDVQLMLGRCPDAPVAADIGDHSYLAYFTVDDVEAFHARALEAGAHVSKPPTAEPWGMREMAIASPEGHRFMLAQPM